MNTLLENGRKNREFQGILHVENENNECVQKA
jgi:hypothetical protein